MASRLLWIGQKDGRLSKGVLGGCFAHPQCVGAAIVGRLCGGGKSFTYIICVRTIFPPGCWREAEIGCTRTWDWSQGLPTLKGVLGSGFHHPQCVGARAETVAGLAGARAPIDFGGNRFSSRPNVLRELNKIRLQLRAAEFTHPRPGARAKIEAGNQICSSEWFFLNSFRISFFPWSLYHAIFSVCECAEKMATSCGLL
jgi:hypothetical protein